MLAVASEKHSVAVASAKHSVAVAKLVEDVTAGNITNSGVKGLLLEELHSQILDRSGKHMGLLQFLSPRIKSV